MVVGHWADLLESDPQPFTLLSQAKGERMRFGLTSMFYKYVNDWQLLGQPTFLKTLDLVSCRRDTASFQAVIRSEEPILLTTGHDTLFWKGGSAQIGRLEVELDEEAISVQTRLIGLIPDDNGCPTSDILLEQSTLFVEAKQVQQVWIECQIPADLAPQTYHGSVRLYGHTMFEDEQLLEECSFSITVKDVVMPEPADYRLYLDLWQHNSNIARKYQVELWSDEHFAIMENYIQSLARLGQKAATVIVSEIPWSGQGSFTDREPSDLYEYSMVKVTKEVDGRFVYDYTALDRYVELTEKYGIASEIEVFGLLNIWQYPDYGYGPVVEDHPDAIRIRYYDAASKTYKFIRARQELEQYITALGAHFTTKGWTERVRILADEPADLELFKTRWQLFQQLLPSFKLKVAINHVEFVQQGVPNLSDAVPNLDCSLQEHSKLMETRAQLPGKLLYYVCCRPLYPNTFIGSPGLESRVLIWLVEKLRLDGFLRWNYTVWPDRPLEKISYRPTIWPAGDTCFVYPGACGKPLLSLRYKWLERAIKDYELMQIAKQNGRAEWVNDLLRRVFRFDDPSELRRGATPDEFYSLQLEDYERLLVEW